MVASKALTVEAGMAGARTGIPAAPRRASRALTCSRGARRVGDQIPAYPVFAPSGAVLAERVLMLVVAGPFTTHPAIDLGCIPGIVDARRTEAEDVGIVEPDRPPHSQAI